MSTGAMIALIPSGEDLDRLALPDGEPRDEIHMTMWYLGDAADIPGHLQSAIRHEIESRARDNLLPIDADAFAVNLFNPNSDDSELPPAWVLGVGGDGLRGARDEFHQGIVNAPGNVSDQVDESQAWEMPPNHDPWVAHVTLVYDTADEARRLGELRERLGPMTFTHVRVAFGDEVVDFPLGRGGTVATQEASQEVLMPYKKVHNHSGCPSSKPWGVVNSQSGDLKGCHTSEDRANAQLGILARAERGEPIKRAEVEALGFTVNDFADVTFADDDAPAGDGDGECPPGHHRMPDGNCMPDIAMGEDVLEFDDDWGVETLQGLDAESRRKAAGSGAALADGSFPIRNCREVEKAVHAMNRPTNNSKDTIRGHIVRRAKALGCTSHLPADWPSSTKKAAAVEEPELPDEVGETTLVDDTWHGVLAVEGVPTGDGREFAPGSLEWRNLPLSLYWQRQTADGHDQSVIVGSIDNIWRDGGLIRAIGRFNLNAPENGQSRKDAEDAYQLVHDGFMRGVSVTLDDIKDNDVEMVWPEEGETAAEGEANPLQALFAKPEKVIFHHGRVIDATLTGQPALQEAFVACGPYEEAVEESPDMSVVVAAHSTATSDGPWVAGDHLRRLGPLDAELVARTFGWVRGRRGEAVNRADCLFLHHEISDSGHPGPANLTACSAAVGLLNGARGGASIPVADRQGVYDHLAAHLRDAGREPQPLMTPDEAEDYALVAAAVHSPVAPPTAWFDDPGFEEITPLMVGDDGFIRGHLARWGVCHTSFPGTCVTPPREDDYGFFTTGEIVTRDGSRIPVGQLTLGTGHAPAGLGARPASVHYDHTGYAVADVAAGSDEYGIWVAGALCPDVDEITIRRLRASALSGDWRRIGGQLRLVAALVVNVPGFPIPRPRTRSQDGNQTALVAAGIVANVEPPSRRQHGELSPTVAKLVVEALESRVRHHVVARLDERVHAG